MKDISLFLKEYKKEIDKEIECIDYFFNNTDKKEALIKYKENLYCRMIGEKFEYGCTQNELTTILKDLHTNNLVEIIIKIYSNKIY